MIKRNGTGAITIQEVAARVGVSKQAVAAVVNGSRSGTRVSEETRRRIMAAVAELGYRPNAIAQSLRQKRTGIIGYYSGHPLINPNTPFQAELLTGMQLSCEQHQKDLMLHGKYQGRSTEDIYAQLANGKIDGLVLFSPPDDTLAQHLADSPLPVVAITDAISVLPSVVVDDRAGGRLQAEHLAEKGYRGILYRTMGERHLVSAVRRFTAFQEAATELGLTLVASSGDSPADLRLTESEHWILQNLPRPTAIVGWQDGAAIRLLHAVLATGLSVPEDVGVVGFDGIPVPASTSVGSVWNLTTIRAPWQEVAATAVSLLVEQLEGREVPKETVLPVTLVQGNTT